VANGHPQGVFGVFSYYKLVMLFLNMICLTVASPLENFVQRDVDGAYLELLEGELVVEFLGSDDAKNQSDIEIKNVSLSHPRTRIQVPSGEFHRVHTVGKLNFLNIK
jgi:hypothetical protein